MTDAATLLRAARTLPVLAPGSVEQALALADALADGGLTTLEITLRTPAALQAIERLRAERPRLVIGAGTIRSPAELDAALRAGAAFAVSPGATPTLLAAARECGVPFVPGVATPSEALRAGEEGFRVLKFFPAEASGGAAALRAWAAPLPEFTFCPTGGLDAAKVLAYRTLPNVICVGGAWMVPPAALAAGDWGAIRAAARQCSA